MAISVVEEEGHTMNSNIYSVQPLETGIKGSNALHTLQSMVLLWSQQCFGTVIQFCGNYSVCRVRGH